MSRSIVDSVLEDPRPTRLSLEPLDDFVVVEYAEEEGVSPGDKVLFPKDAGYDVRLAGTAQKVLKREHLIARILD
jgi:co-chaperonin GroES (HSP10)